MNESVGYTESVAARGLLDFYHRKKRHQSQLMSVLIRLQFPPLWLYLTKHFTILEPENPVIAEFDVLRKRRSPD